MKNSTGKKLVKCYYVNDGDCPDIEYEVSKFNSNYVVCETCKKLGKKNPDKRSNHETLIKREKTNIERFGPDYKKIQSQKSQQTTIKTHGGIGRAVPEFDKKFKETMKKKYGVDSPMDIPSAREKVIKCCIETAKERSDKRKETFRLKYGDNIVSSLQLKSIRELSRQRYYEKTGYYHPMYNPEVKEKVVEKLQKKFLLRLFNSDRLKSICRPNFNIEDYNGVKNNEYSWICSQCGNEFKAEINNGRIPRCPICYPKKHNGYNISEYEYQIIDFIKEITNNSVSITHNDKVILNGKELDIYIPDYNLAIEFDGLYWHSEKMGRDKHYHLQKTQLCEEKGIQLVHIFEDEWYYKQDIVKSIIQNKLGFSKKIYARKCELYKPTIIEAKQFYFDNHIQSHMNGSHFALNYNDQIVMMITIGKSRFNKNYQYEIYRSCSLKNHIVIGGLSKLFKFVINNIDPKSILTYADARFGKGLSYEKIGFEYDSYSNPNYYYLKHYGIRESRMKYQKHKLGNILENFDPSLTEWENMQLNGYDRIWDCGNYIYTWKKA